MFFVDSSKPTLISNLVSFLIYIWFHIPLYLHSECVSDLDKLLFLNVVSSDATAWGFFNLSCLTWSRAAFRLPVTKEKSNNLLVTVLSVHIEALCRRK